MPAWRSCRRERQGRVQRRRCGGDGGRGGTQRTCGRPPKAHRPVSRTEWEFIISPWFSPPVSQNSASRRFCFNAIQWESARSAHELLLSCSRCFRGLMRPRHQHQIRRPHMLPSVRSRAAVRRFFLAMALVTRCRAHRRETGALCHVPRRTRHVRGRRELRRQGLGGRQRYRCVGFLRLFIDGLYRSPSVLYGSSSTPAVYVYTV